MAKAPTGKQLATALIEKFPQSDSRQIARILHKEHSARYETFNAAYLAVRRARGNQGNKTRGEASKSVERPSRLNYTTACPPSAAEPWLPVQIDGPCRVLSLSDLHIPYHSKEAIEAAVKHGRKLKPDVLLLNGDFADFYRISRFQQNHKARLFKEEIAACREALSWLRGQFQKARIIYKMGNHDERWNHYIYNKSPELIGLECAEIQDALKFADYGIERVDDNPIMAGVLPILHGHEIGKGIFSPVNPARGAYLRTSHTVLIGHLHRSSSHAQANMWHDETMTWSQGALCALTPEYARVNSWNWGFASIDVATDNQFNLNNYRISADHQVRTA